MNKDTPAVPADGVPGMTLRAYLVAHAPAVPEGFEPVMPKVIEPDMPFPAGSPKAGLLATAKLEKWSRDKATNELALWPDAERIVSLKYLDALRTAEQQRQANQHAYPLERAVQWPLEWADAVIERLG